MIAGPALVDWAKLGDVSKEELGASRIHTRNGAIDDEVASEAEAFERAARFLSYLPTNVDELPPIVDTNDDPERREEFLLDVVPNDPRKVYKMRPIIEAVVDRDSFFEIGRAVGQVDHQRARAARRRPGRTVRRRPVRLRRRVDGGCVAAN